MEIDIGLWRSTLGDTHPHQGVFVERDFWPQSVLVEASLFDEADAGATAALSATLVGCFAGVGGGSQQAMFRRDLVPLLEAAVERWRARPRASLSAALDGFFTEVQRGFETLASPWWHAQLQASSVSALFDRDHLAIASTGLDDAYRLRAGRLERVSRPLSQLELLSPAEASALPEIVHSLFKKSPGGFFGHPSFDNRTARPDKRWQIEEITLEPGDLLVLLSGMGGFSELDRSIVEEALANTHGAPLPSRAQAMGEFFANPYRWSRRLDERRVMDERWRVISRLSLALLRVGA